MKKFGKFLFGTITVASIAASVYYVYKNFINKDSSDDFDDFEDDLEDFDTEEDAKESDTRGYVPINLAPSEAETTETDDAEQPTQEAVSEENLH